MLNGKYKIYYKYVQLLSLLTIVAEQFQFYLLRHLRFKL